MTRPILPRLLAKKIWLPLFAGGIAMQVSFSGCQTDVRDTVLAGIQNAAITLTTAVFNAFFLALSNAGNSTSQSVVQATFDQMKNWLA